MPGQAAISLLLLYCLPYYNVNEIMSWWACYKHNEICNSNMFFLFFFFSWELTIVSCETWHMTHDIWQVAGWRRWIFSPNFRSLFLTVWELDVTCKTWHVTPDTWHLTWDMWHLTCVRWQRCLDIFTNHGPPVELTTKVFVEQPRLQRVC